MPIAFPSRVTRPLLPLACALACCAFGTGEPETAAALGGGHPRAHSVDSPAVDLDIELPTVPDPPPGVGELPLPPLPGPLPNLPTPDGTPEPAAQPSHTARPLPTESPDGPTEMAEGGASTPAGAPRESPPVPGAATPDPGAGPVAPQAWAEPRPEPSPPPAATAAPGGRTMRLLGVASMVALILLVSASLALRLAVGCPRFPPTYRGRRRVKGGAPAP